MTKWYKSLAIWVVYCFYSDKYVKCLSTQIIISGHKDDALIKEAASHAGDFGLVFLLLPSD